MKKFLKPTVLALVLSSTMFSGVAMSATVTGESLFTNSVKGWAPYLPKVGTRYVGGAQKPNPKVGDVIEVPTYLINNALYTYADGNGVQDTDRDNESRVRPGQMVNVPTGVTQKVSVYWYMVKPKADKEWAPVTATETDLEDAATNPTWIRSWDDVDATPVAAEDYNLPEQGTKSLAVKVPAAAVGQRLGFIIVPESETGDPARGAPLKVPDINFIWGQTAPEGPGDLCEVPPPDFPGDIATWTPPEDCEVTPTDPGDKNPDNGGGDVEKSNYIVTIYKLNDTTGGIPNTGTDPILGTASHPHPLVNTTYYATIKVLVQNSDPEAIPVYRELTDTEAESIDWSIFNPKVRDDIGLITDAPDTPEYQTAYQAAVTANLIDTVSVAGGSPAWNDTDRTGIIAGTGDQKFYTFRTQLDNANGLATFANIGTKWMLPNGEESEQGTLLRVTFDYNDAVTAP